MPWLAQRITIMIDDEIAKKIRSMQAKFIREKNKSKSFSAMLNDVLRKGLK